MLFTVALSGFVSRKRLSTLAALVFAIAANPVLGDIMPVAMRDYPCLGGIVNVAISIESGRETRVQNVNLRGARVGLHVMRGSGNLLTNIHPLLSRVSNERFFDASVGFDDNSDNNSYLRCYSDQFSTGWLFGLKSDNADLDGCFCYWYDSDPGKRHTAIRCEGQFRALVSDLWAGFRNNQATNAVLLVGESGGHGVIRDIRLVDDRLNSSDDAFREYLQGTMHK